MRARRFIGLAAILLSLAPAWGFYQLVTGTPWLIVLVAAVPAAAWTALILVLDADEPEPLHILLTMFWWGAVVAAISSQAVNDNTYQWIALAAGVDRARALTPAFLAPLCEEVLKAGGLVLLWALWREDIAGVRDGIVYGAVIGMGFAMTENVTYFLVATVQGGVSGLTRAIYLRALLQGFNHAAFTATTGAALGWMMASARRAWWAPAAGLVAAVGQHILWNALGSAAVTQLLCGATSPGGACLSTPTDESLFVAVPAVVVAFLVPGGVVVMALAMMARRPKVGATS